MPVAQKTLVRVSLLALALIVLAGAGAYLWSANGETRAGTFVLSSQPPGAQVVVDGVAAGVTPLALQLAPGAHAIVATSTSGIAETLSASVAPGETVGRHLVLDPPSPPAATTGEPGGASTPGGPLSNASGAPAPSAAAPPPPVPSFVTFALPFAAQVYEGDTLLGSSDERLRVRPGTRTFTIVNQQLGFRVDDSVVVAAGRSVRRSVAAPSAALSINATPWAEVFIAGQSYGETPLANVALPIGTYQVTLRHPTLGERTVPVTVRLGTPNRLAADLRR